MTTSAVKTVDDYKSEFLSKLEQYVGKREGYDTLVKYLTSNSDFFTAPAEAEGLWAYEGGLVQYSLKVCDRFLSNITIADTMRPKEKQMKAQESEMMFYSGTLCCLLQGIALANHFESYNENEGTGKEPKIKYRVKENPFGYGRPDEMGLESVYILKRFIELSHTEAFAIRYQQGSPDNPYMIPSFRKYPLAYEVYRANLDVQVRPFEDD